MRKVDETSNKVLLRCAVAILFFVFGTASTESQAFPYELSYASRITDAQGVPLTGPVDIKVDFFNDPTSDNARINIPTVEISRVPLADGVFQLSITLTPAEFNTVFANNNDTVYIQVTDVTHGKTFQRQQFGAAPYALKIPIDSDALRYNNQGQLTLGTNAPATGQVLMANGSRVQWVDLTGPSLTTTTPSSGQILGFNGTSWVPQTAPAGGTGGGGVQAGSGVSVTTTGGISILSLDTAGTAGTYTKITTDAYGRVSSGSTLSASDIPSHSADLITSGTLSKANGGTGINSTATFPTVGVVVTRDATETLINKTLTAATINGTSNIGGSTIISTTGTLTAQNITSQGNLTVRGDGTTSASKLVLNDKGNNNYIAIKAPDTLASQLSWELPSTNGTAGQFLSTNGAGTLSWASGVAPTGPASGDLTGSFPGPTLVAVGSAGSYTKVTTDSKGRVISGTTLISSDLPPVSASGITGTLAVASGGTGVTGFTNNGVVIGSGTALSSTAAGTQYNVFVAGASGNPSFGQVNLSSTSAVSGVLPIANGGLGISQVPSSGKILVGNGTGYSLGTISLGTTQGVSVTSSGSDIVLDTAQDIRTSATPNFAGLTVNGVAANSLLKSNGSKALTSAASSDVISTLGFTPLNRAGDSMSGTLNMNSQAITNAGNIMISAARTLGLGVFDNTSEATMIASLDSSGATSPDKGKTWFNSTANQIKYWTGSTAQALGISGAGLTSLNGLTVSPQTFASGTAGTSPAFSSSGTVHTLNVPLASTAGVSAGVISNSDYVSFSGKLNGVAAGTGVTVSTASGTATVSLSSVGSAGTYTKVQTNAQGQVINGSSLIAGDIPSLDASKIGTGQISVANGGTGVGTFSLNGVLIGNGTNYLVSTATPSADQILRVTSAGGQPSFGAIDLSKSASVGGILGSANGGTGASSTTANYVFAGPTGGGSGAPSFRALVAGDIPAMGGANGALAGTAGAVPQQAPTDNMKFLRGDGLWATPAAAAGSSSQIQYNSAGNLAGSPNFVYSGGNLGIGTTAPAGKLDVAGTICLSGANCISSWPAGSVTSVSAGTGLTGGPITSSGSLSLANTGVTAGSYTRANFTVDAQGRITAANNSSLIVDADISSSAAIADSKLAMISTAGKVSGSAITSGTIGGTTAIVTTGNITAPSLNSTTNLVAGATNDLSIKADTNAGGAGSLQFYTRNVERMRIANLGYIGIGTTNPNHALHVVGTAGLSTGTSWTNASDVRLKDVQGDYEYGLTEVKKLHTIRFNYKKDNPLNLPYNQQHTGFIAQEVKELIPDAVITRPDGYLELNVDPIHWATVNAVKELAAENDRLKAEFAQMKAFMCGQFPNAPICNL